MIRYSKLAAALTVVMIVAALAPFGAAAAQPDADDLSLVVSDDRVVTVTANDSAVENATVAVTTDDDSYAGTGNYSTDADGTVELPEPDESVTVTITASTTADSVDIETVLEPEDDAPEDLSVDVSQNGDVVVTVADDGDELENATVDVTVAEDDGSYAETGEYETDENGTVTLESPNETVDVTFEATVEGVSAQTTETLEADDTSTDLSIAVSQNETVTVVVTDDGDEIENATVDVATDENATYAETGNYSTDENGTVSLAAPNETVDVTFTATVDDESVTTTTATLEPSEDDADEDRESFGSIVSAFVKSVQTDGPPGRTIADFVVGNNPGNAPDHAGPGSADDAGNSSDRTDDDNQRGPPDHAGPSDDAGGPPDHAGPGPADDDGNATDDSSSDETDDDNQRGPPDNAGSSDDAGGPPDHAGP